MTARRSFVIAYAVVALAALAVHARTIAFGLTNLDDRDLVVDDRPFLLQAATPSGARAVFSRAYMHVVDGGHAYYRPLVTLSYAVDARWTGGASSGFHLTNVALHALASVLVLGLFVRFAMPLAIAVPGALIFAVHPVLAAAVAWIPGRNDSLLAVFALSAWLCFDGDRAVQPWGRRLAHLTFFGLALLTKETAIVLPVIWAASVLLAPRDGATPTARARAMAFYGLAWILAGVAWLAARHAAEGGGAGPDLAGMTSGALALVVAMLGKVAFPVHPTVLGVSSDVAVWPGVAVLGALAGSALVLSRVAGRVRVGLVVLGVGAFAIFLIPTLATNGTLLLDNRLVMPAVGVLLAIAELVRAAALGGPAPLETRLLVAFGAIGVVVLAAITGGYEGAYADRRAFARAAVADAPRSGLAHFCMGQSEQSDGDDDRALAEYAASLALGPGEIVHNNIAVIAMKRGRWTDAERELRQELELNPRYARAYENLAIVLRHEGRDDEAAATGVAHATLEGR